MGGEEVKQGDEGALELGATAGVDSGRGEALPDDHFEDVGGDEEPMVATAVCHQLVVTQLF